MSTRNVVLLAIGLVVLSAYATMSFVMRSEEVEVPDIQGLRIMEAQNLLESRRLVMKERERRFHEKVPDGCVVEQDPPALETTKRGRTVWVVVSKGSMTVTAPDLRDQPLRQAELKLRANGLVRGYLSKTPHPEAAETVIAQTPEFGSTIARGGPVSVLVSTGPEPIGYVMPEMTGWGLTRVKQTLARMGILRRKLMYEVHEDLPDQIVLKQSPAAGVKVLVDDTVELVLNAKSKSSTVEARMIQVNFEVPKGGGLMRRVRMTVTDDQGQREFFNELRETGVVVKTSIRATGEAVVEIYLDQDTEPVEVIQQ